MKFQFKNIKIAIVLLMIFIFNIITVNAITNEQMGLSKMSVGSLFSLIDTGVAGKAFNNDLSKKQDKIVQTSCMGFYLTTEILENSHKPEILIDKYLRDVNGELVPNLGVNFEVLKTLVLKCNNIQIKYGIDEIADQFVLVLDDADFEKVRIDIKKVMVLSSTNILKGTIISKFVDSKINSNDTYSLTCYFKYFDVENKSFEIISDNVSFFRSTDD